MAVALLALLAQSTPVFAESAIEAAYALLRNQGDYEPTPPSGTYFKSEPVECRNGKSGCFSESSFKRIDDCRYIVHHYTESDPEHPGHGGGKDAIFDFGKARTLEFRKVPVYGEGEPVPGIVIDGEDDLICIRLYRGRTPDGHALDATKCRKKYESYYTEKRTALNARPNQTLFGVNGDHVLKIPNQAHFRRHWAVLREYCPGPTGN
ncbi:hypothetical protein [Methylocystis suflitae]|uniref:hypothetical protein n=1 Tax=Methylocystis suflitae TaxID=2951405 RepID=UPI00210B2D66|nr:hypothetical protein [Methylocystis suflitae]MCQ4188611.1 hypothetical protein [Methylocystis suflitae]